MSSNTEQVWIGRNPFLSPHSRTGCVSGAVPSTTVYGRHTECIISFCKGVLFSFFEGGARVRRRGGAFAIWYNGQSKSVSYKYQSAEGNLKAVPPAMEMIRWTSFFLDPPTESWWKGRSIVYRGCDIGSRCTTTIPGHALCDYVPV